MTKQRIDAAIKHLNLEIVRGNGYQYFLELGTGEQAGESVMVCYLKQMPLERWITEAEAARKALDDHRAELEETSVKFAKQAEEKTFTVFDKKDNEIFDSHSCRGIVDGMSPEAISDREFKLLKLWCENAKPGDAFRGRLFEIACLDNQKITWASTGKIK